MNQQSPMKKLRQQILSFTVARSRCMMSYECYFNVSYHSQLWISLIRLLALHPDEHHLITHLENTIGNVSNWISSNFLSLIDSKTEFLIFGLPQQLSKLNTIHLPNNVILSPVDSVRNLYLFIYLVIQEMCNKNSYKRQ